jgi:hypothetical protein
MQYMRETADYEKSDYQYSLNARRESIARNRKALDEIKRDAYGTTLREAMGSADLAGFIPDLFLDEIQLLGQRTAWARNTFPVVAQSTQSSFKHRYRWKDEQIMVTSKELVEVKATQSEREVQEFSFLKLLNANTFSLEMLEDSPLSEATAEIQLSASKFYRMENQLMAHRLTEWSQGAYATKWSNHVEGPTDSGTDDEVIESMESAFLDMTTRLADAFSVDSLIWVVSPSRYARLFRNASFRRWDILGSSPSFITGKAGAGDDRIFRIPIQIAETGYFDKQSTWVPCPDDCFLIAPQFCAGIRERWSMRTNPLDNLTKILAQGMMMYERIIPWIRNAFAMLRISPTASYTSDIIGNMSNINIAAGKSDTTVFPA